ncbi:MAG: hypothetical protein FJ039_08920 [Chloroflexi bacterium]|nr:hypothetical protein [Chloroflexota bacterium]
MAKERKLPRPFAMPWGKGNITEEVQVIRDHWEPAIQLMEYEDGSKSLRFCFYTKGRFNRNPMMLGEEDLDEMAAELKSAPKIKAMLKRLAK